MFLHPSLYLVSLLLATVVYWSIPKSIWTARAVFLSVLSVVLVSLMVPALGVFMLASSLLANSYQWLRQKSDNVWIAVVFIFAQLALMVMPDLTPTFRLAQKFTFVGLTYFTLRNVGYIIDVYKKKTKASYLDLLFLNAFFPTYSAGPIENVKTLNAESCKVEFSLSDFQMGIVRILVGILKFYLVSEVFLGNYITHNLPQKPETIVSAYPEVVIYLAVLGWLNLYVAFSGYADIAIGSAKLFGIKVRENFQFPFLATNIQKFWQRWNISVMNFVSEYVFLNFVRKTGWRIVGIYLVFFCMGMWHRVSPNYIVWAIGHGSAMSLTVFFRRRTFFQRWQEFSEKNKVIRWPIIVVNWILTLVFISIMSAVANAPDIEHGIAILKGLFI